MFFRYSVDSCSEVGIQRVKSYHRTTNLLTAGITNLLAAGATNLLATETHKVLATALEKTS